MLRTLALTGDDDSDIKNNVTEREFAVRTHDFSLMEQNADDTRTHFDANFRLAHFPVDRSVGPTIPTNNEINNEI